MVYGGGMRRFKVKLALTAESLILAAAFTAALFSALPRSFLGLAMVYFFEREKLTL